MRLEDCKLNVSNMFGINYAFVELPNQIDFSKVAFVSNSDYPEFVDNTQGGHARFSGNNGEAYIGCDGVVRFISGNPEYHNVERGLESCGTWNPEKFRGCKFRLRLGEQNISLKEREFLETFLDWINEYSSYDGFLCE